MNKIYFVRKERPETHIEIIIVPIEWSLKSLPSA